MEFPFTILTLAQADNPSDTGASPTPAGGEASSGSPGAGGGGSAPAANPWGSAFIFIPLLLIMVVMIWTSSSAQRKEKKKREQMLGALKRHDRVQTIGGLIGSVVEIKDSEVVLKVDEANNVKMRFAKSAVQQVLSEGEGEAASGGR
ncbi:MAG: preprotein translocase subunit YajC [Phycisphaerales bacterium]|nr:preprotein translocase subunit YajC [Phycisphaerales bacterium]